MQQIHLIHLDPCPLLLSGLATIVQHESDIVLKHQSASVSDLYRLWQIHLPDLAIVDMADPSDAICAQIRQVIRHWPNARILALSPATSQLDMLKSFNAGVMGYVLRNAGSSIVLQAIRAVAQGKQFISNELSTMLRPNANVDKLTHRELQILQRVSQGEANRHIADRLYISEWTVKSHMKSILSKLNAISRTEAVSIGLKRGLINI